MEGQELHFWMNVPLKVEPEMAEVEGVGCVVKTTIMKFMITTALPATVAQSISAGR